MKPLNLTTNLIKSAYQELLLPAHLTEQHLLQVLHMALTRRVDYADLYLQKHEAESWFLEDSVVKEGSYVIDKGFGLRLIHGQSVSLAYSDDINGKALNQAALQARSILQQGNQKNIIASAASAEPSFFTE